MKVLGRIFLELLLENVFGVLQIFGVGLDGPVVFEHATNELKRMVVY